MSRGDDPGKGRVRGSWLSAGIDWLSAGRPRKNLLERNKKHRENREQQQADHRWGSYPLAQQSEPRVVQQPAGTKASDANADERKMDAVPTAQENDAKRQTRHPMKHPGVHEFVKTIRHQE